MINPKAINQFFTREVRDLHRLKKAKREDLSAALEKAGMHFKMKPFLHQLACTYAILKYGSILLFLDTGSGKTFVALNSLWWLLRKKRATRALVLTPQTLHFDSWERNVQAARPELSMIPMHGSSKERWKLLKNNHPDIFVLNYDGLNAMVTEIADVVRKGKKVRKRVIISSLIEELASYFDVLILDECQQIKNPNSLSYKVCEAVGQKMQYRIGMSGTPFNRDPRDLWSQFHVVDGGESLGYTYFFYLQAFFKKQKEFWGGFTWHPKKSKSEDLKRMMRNRSIAYEITECHDMPTKNEIPMYVESDDVSSKYYQQVRESMKKAVTESDGNKLLMKNLFMRARQITSGFVNVRDAETEEVELIEMPSNPKLEALVDILSTLDSDEKVLVFFEFTWSGEQIAERLKKEGISHTLIHGKIKGARNEASKRMKSFIDGDTRVLLINSNMGATGHDGMQHVCRYGVFYEAPVSSIILHQAIARLWRTGQKEIVFFYYLLVKNSVDESIMRFHAEGRDLQEFLLHDMKGNVDAIL